MQTSRDDHPPAPGTALSGPHDYVSRHLASAMARREMIGALDDSNLDAALSLYVRRARAEDVAVERMIVALKQLLAEGFRMRRADEDREQVMAAVVSRAIARYYRDD